MSPCHIISSSVLDLIGYLSRHPHGIDSDTLIEKYASRMRTETDKYTFRQLLRQIAICEKPKVGNKPGKWKLKQELGINNQTT